MSNIPVTDNGSIEADLDPTAEFLAREQETLAGLIEDDHVSVTSNGHLETNGSSEFLITLFCLFFTVFTILFFLVLVLVFDTYI